MSELKRYYAPHVLPERRYHDETEVVLAADHDAEIAKLKELLENAEWLLVEQFMEAEKIELSSKITSYLYQNEAAK